MVASSDVVRSDSEFRAKEKDKPALFFEWTYLTDEDTSRSHHVHTKTLAHHHDLSTAASLMMENLRRRLIFRVARVLLTADCG